MGAAAMQGESLAQEHNDGLEGKPRSIYSATVCLSMWPYKYPERHTAFSAASLWRGSPAGEAPTVQEAIDFCEHLQYANVIREISLMWNE